MKYIVLFILLITFELSAMSPQSLDPQLQFQYTYEGTTLSYVVTQNIYPYKCGVEKASTELEGNIIIPETVNYDGNEFEVGSIEHSAFHNCIYLTSVTMPNTITYICWEAFFQSWNLKSVVLSEALTNIQRYAFYDCWGLETISIPQSIKVIEEGAFQNCRNLTKIFYNCEQPITADETVFNDYSTPVLYVPKSALDRFHNTMPWKLFHNIEAYDFAGLDEVMADAITNNSIEVFNLNGMKVSDNTNSLPQGIYIMRQGNITKKILIK